MHLVTSYIADRSKSVTDPMPSHREHMPPARVNTRFSVFLRAPFSIEIEPAPRTDGVLKENALGGPTYGLPSRMKTIRNNALASVAVPTVERALAPILS